MHPYYIELKNIVDDSIKNSIDDFKLKPDNSLVTEVDYKIDKKIVEWFLKKSNDINPVIITEESYEAQNTQFSLENTDFLILDPIDGTENFGFFKKLFGSVCSFKLKQEEFHFIYIPEENLFLSVDTLEARTPSSLNSIKLLSSGTVENYLLQNSSDAKNIRVFGSSSYMFSLLLRGFCASYHYLADCKIWDCYTGLKLCYYSGMKIEGINVDTWFDNPTYKSNFIVKWK